MKMSSILGYLQQMFELELYSNVSRVCDIALTAAEQKPESLSQTDKSRILFYYADSLYHNQKYLRAEKLYRKLLQFRKGLNKKNSNEINSDIEIKFKIHKCCLGSKQKNAAVEILQSISPRLRTPKVNMALASLYDEMGMQRTAITCFKEVLRETPLALEAVDNLLKLGVSGAEVNTFTIDVSPDINWLNLWMKAQAQFHSKDFASAISTLKSMDIHGFLMDNPTLLVTMGYCYNYMHNYDSAIAVLQRAMRLDPDSRHGRDLLATLLSSSGKNDHLRCLENLCPTQDMSLWSSEDWVVLGNHVFVTKKYDKAIYFGQQALLQTRNIEALLLKAKTLMEMGKFQESATHCTEAIQICPFRYDLHHCLVESYIKMNRLREADTMALNACKQLNYSPQALTLHATVLLKSTMTPPKTVRKILEQAVAQDKTMTTPAVFMLAELLEQEQQHEQVKQLLLKYIDDYPSSRLHQMLGDCFINLQKDEEAFDHYHTALRLDPNNQRATEGLNNIGGKPQSLSTRDSYYSCVEETPHTPQGTSASVNDYPESDTDSWPANNSFE